jgi:hypothetical protein
VSLPVVWQLLGLAMATTGLYLLAGVAWALIAGGAALVVWGVVGEVAGVAIATRPPRTREVA